MGENNNELRRKGVEMFKRCYGDNLPEPPAKGQDPFFDIMIENLFGAVWGRETLCLRDRRLFTMGIIAAMGEKDVFQIQAASALANGELNAEQLREMVIHAAPYAGYPRVGGLRSAVETAITHYKKGSKD